MSTPVFNTNFVKVFVALLFVGVGFFVVAMPRETAATQGQRWDTPPPPTSYRTSTFQINCYNYQGAVNALVGDLDEVNINLNGAYPPCGEPVNIYDALIESTPNGIKVPSGVLVKFCLSNTTPRIGVPACIEQGDTSVVSTILAEAYETPALQAIVGGNAEPVMLEKTTLSNFVIMGRVPETVSRDITSGVTAPATEAASAAALKFPPSAAELKAIEAKIIQLQEQLTTLLRQISGTAATAAPNAVQSPAKITQWMYRGSSGEDVRRLQEFLAKDRALYPEGIITGYFGTLTEKAVQRFQKKYGIVNSGDPITTGFGFVGPQTLKKLNDLLLQ